MSVEQMLLVMLGTALLTFGIGYLVFWEWVERD